MTRKNTLPEHIIRTGRISLGKNPDGTGRERFGTTVSCTCGKWTRAINTAPTAGGSSRAVTAHQDHITDVISRDSIITVTHARTEWTPWQPGDGTRYTVRIMRVSEGPDYGDRVLLISVDRRTWAFQYPPAGYRRDEMGSRTARCAKLSKGVPEAIWRAVLPLLIVMGVV